MPPSFKYDRERLERFFCQLPRDTQAAAKLGRRHDKRLDGRAWTRAEERMPLRHAMEVRHASFENEEFIKLLRAHDIGLVIADTAGKWPFMEDVTSDFVYVRLHGDEELYASGYTDEALKTWARKIRAWARGTTPAGAKLAGARGPSRKGGRDVFVYFDNDVKVRAPFDAMKLAHALGKGPPAPDDPTKRGRNRKQA